MEASAVAPVVYPTAHLRAAIEETRQATDLSPQERFRRLRLVRDEVHSVLGSCEAAMGDAESEMGYTAAADARDLSRAREDATIREELVSRGMLSEAQADELGMPTHSDLDQRQADGTISSRLQELRESISWREFLHPRGRGGKWVDAPDHAAPSVGGSATGGNVPPTPSTPSRPSQRGTSRPGLPSLAKPEDRTAPGAPAPGTPLHVRPRAHEYEQQAGGAPKLGHVRTPRVDEVLGEGVRDSLDKHTEVGPDGERRYTPERRAQHKQWALEILGDHAEGLANPEVLFTAGGPASGKSSIIEPQEDGTSRVAQPEDTVHLDQDIVKAKMDEYQQLSGTGPDGKKLEGVEPDAYASDAVHREASDVYRVVMAEAMRRRMNLIAEGTGDSGDGQFAQKLRDAKDAGYKVRVVYASAPTAVAEERAAYRAKKTGRAVPLDGLRTMHRNVSAWFPQVQKAAEDGAVDELTVWDTRGNSWEGEPPVQMAELGDGGALSVVNRELFDQFLAKGSEPADPTLISLPSFI